MTLADALREAASGRLRVPIATIWTAFQRAFPLEAAAPDARERLGLRLAALAEAGEVRLPAARGPAWDRSATPPLPAWVALTRPVAAPEAVDPTTIAWAPELAFVATSPHVDVPAALAIQRFLAEDGRARPLVPMRERSVQLFGDEKRLDRLVRTPLFAPGRLTLATLRCFPMAPPLVFEPGPPGRPALVIENHHTWWSFCRWNERVGAYSAVVYGAGGGFGREAVAFLAERCVAWGAPHAEYFGDLDFDGLVIPWRADRQYGGVPIVAAEAWYAILLDLADHAGLPRGPRIEVPPEVMDWLPAPVQPEVRRWFADGVRIPQELVGTEVLARVGSGIR